jgi:hypothetical protein
VGRHLVGHLVGHLQSDRRQSALSTSKAMHIHTFSLLPLFFAIAAGTLGPTSASLAAKHPESKTAAAKKAVSSKKAVASKKAAAAAIAMPPLAAQLALADNAPALPAKARVAHQNDDQLHRRAGLALGQAQAHRSGHCQ